MISKSTYPKNLRIGICWQHCENDIWDNLDEFKNDDRFKIIDINYTESKGVCWARSMVQSLYFGEEFTLQIDSHMRFIDGWDVELINMWHSLNDAKALLTTYPSQYYPDKRETEWGHEPHIIHVHSIKNGQTEQRPNTSTNWRSRNTPYKAVHIAAGFIFTIGRFITDVPYDPEFYFSGEETSLSIRSFTNGYNIYHPHKLLLWHYYTRKDQVKHWDDHSNWGHLSNIAHDRLNCLLGRNDKYDLGKYCLGKIRTLEDYQNYSGIDYKRNILHRDTIECKEPPVDLSDISKWSYTIKIFKQKISWNYEEIDTTEEPRFWAFIFKDQNDQELYRKDITLIENIDLLTGKITEKEFEFSYYSPAQIPTTFIIWSYSQKSMQWLKATKFQIQRMLS